MTIQVERILRGFDDKQIGVTAIIDGVRVPKLQLSDLRGYLNHVGV